MGIEAKVTHGEKAYGLYNKYFNHNEKPRPETLKSKRIMSTGMDIKEDNERAVSCSECNDSGQISIAIKVKRNNATRYAYEKCVCQNRD